MTDRNNWVLALWLFTLSACGAGQYGYARQYVATGDEDEYLERAQPLSYEEVRRGSGAAATALVTWFGVVTAVEPGEGGLSKITATYRTPQARNLCRDERASSCRVTVSDRPGGVFSAHVRLADEDRSGADAVKIGSLVRIYGRAVAQQRPASATPQIVEGVPTAVTPTDFPEPLLNVEYYRHWPRGTFVTTRAAGGFRQ